MASLPSLNQATPVFLLHSTSASQTPDTLLTYPSASLSWGDAQSFMNIDTHISLLILSETLGASSASVQIKIQIIWYTIYMLKFWYSECASLLITPSLILFFLWFKFCMIYTLHSGIIHIRQYKAKWCDVYNAKSQVLRRENIFKLPSSYLCCWNVVTLCLMRCETHGGKLSDISQLFVWSMLWLTGLCFLDTAAGESILTTRATCKL